jgi:acetolactate synthase-1/2/3 large subunit
MEAFKCRGAAYRTRAHVSGDIVLSDVGSHKMWIGRNYPVYEPHSVIISNGLASMGIALPGGIAAKLAFPHKQVVAMMGDGGFLMNSQEIETARRIRVGFPIIVFNDNDYGLISWKQHSHEAVVRRRKIRFQKYAEASTFRTGRRTSGTENSLKAISSQRLSLMRFPSRPPSLRAARAGTKSM